LVAEDVLEPLPEGRQYVPELRRVDDDLVGGHRQNAFDPGAVERREPHEGTLDRALDTRLDRGGELASVFRQSFVHGLADGEAAGRVDRVVTRWPEARLLGRRREP